MRSQVNFPGHSGVVRRWNLQPITSCLMGLQASIRNFAAQHSLQRLLSVPAWSIVLRMHMCVTLPYPTGKALALLGLPESASGTAGPTWAPRQQLGRKKNVYIGDEQGHQWPAILQGEGEESWPLQSRAANRL